MMEEDWPGQVLHQSALYDNNEAMTDFLQGTGRKNINARDRMGRTPVFTAVSNSSVKCLKVLLQNGADPSMPATSAELNHMTPLHKAIQEGLTEAVELLLEFGADLNRTDQSGRSGMKLAQATGNPELIQLLKNEDERRKKNAWGVVCDLITACDEHNLAQVRDLLRIPPPAGWDIVNLAPDGDGRTAITVTARSGKAAIMSELLSAAAEMKQRPSAMHLAVQWGNVECARVILQHYPECVQISDDCNDTPLHIACKTGCLEMVRLLLGWDYPDNLNQTVVDRSKDVEYKIAIPLNSTNSDNKSPLFLACEADQAKIVKYLLDFTVSARKIKSSNQSQGDGPAMKSVDSNQDGSDVDEFDYHPINVQNDEIVPVKSILMDSAPPDLYQRQIGERVSSGETNAVIYKRVNPGDYSRFCVYVAVKNRYLEVVDALVKANAATNLVGLENDEKYSVLLKLAFDNNDLLMLNKLLHYGVPDVNNFVLKEAVKSKPNYVGHFLKYKASEDKQNNINKALMRKSFMDWSLQNGGSNNFASSLEFDNAVPKKPVHARWKELRVLMTIEEKWLSMAINFVNAQHGEFRLNRFAITRLDVSVNYLTTVPSCVLQLPSLVTLCLSDNAITSFPSEKDFGVASDSLEEILLQKNKLTKLPEYLFRLPKLKTLNASSNAIETLPYNLWEANSLKWLDLSYNQIKKLPLPRVSAERNSEHVEGDMEEYGMFDRSLSSDQSISLEDNHMIIHSIKRANHWMDKLVVSDDDVKNSQTLGLMVLKLNYNCIEVFPDFLSCCCLHLDTLEMKKNKLTRLGNLSAYPRSLKNLDFSDNCIESMADWQKEDERKKCYSRERIVQVTKSGNFVNPNPYPGCCRHRGNVRLENLENLDLSNNRIKSLIVLRSSLKEMILSKSIHDKEQKEEELQRLVLLPSMSILNLNANDLHSLPDEIKELKCLRSLYLNQNYHLIALPPALGLLDRLHCLEVQSCPLEGPIQDVIRTSQSKASDVTGFLRSIHEEAVEYNCMNLMLVGSYDIGKTSLLGHLMKKGRITNPYTVYSQREEGGLTYSDQKGKPLSTVGIDICQLEIEGNQGKVVFRTWDFAGQKEYYATHQYFLSPRSLYLVLWNLKQGEQGIEDLKQWLVNIQAQAQGSAVMIVGTHLDEIQKNRGLYTKTWEKEMEQKIRDKYCRQDNENNGLPNVIDIFSVAAGKSPKYIEELKNRIYSHVFQLRHPARKTEKLLGHKVPKKYLNLQKCIETIANSRLKEQKDPILDNNHYMLLVMDEMQKLDPDVTFRNKNDVDQATRFLHENGVILHFEDIALRDWYFIQPQWLCDKLAKVVSHKLQGYRNEGVMKKTVLEDIYKESRNMSLVIDSLLNKFEVALAIDNDQILLPSLLPTHKDITDPGKMPKIPLRTRTISNGSGPVGTHMEPEFPHGSIHRGEMVMNSVRPFLNPIFSNTRLYLLTYFPSGFWPRLITKVLSDESFSEHAASLFFIPKELKLRCPDLQKAKPSWRCWQTGFELEYLNNTIMQVKEVHCGDTVYGRGLCNYADEHLSIRCHFDNEWRPLDIKDSVILEISFRVDKLTANFSLNIQNSVQPLMPFIEQIDFFHDERAKTGILAKVVEHIDNLLQDWFPEIGESRFNQTCLGRYLVTRVIPCPLCLQKEVSVQSGAQNSWDLITNSVDDTSLSVSVSDVNPEMTDSPKNATAKTRVMCTFLVERCIKNVFDGLDEICDIHNAVSPMMMTDKDGIHRQFYIAPDFVFHDLDLSMLVEDEVIHMTEQLGHGAFGTVYAGVLKRDEHNQCSVAVKVLYDPQAQDKRKGQLMPQICLETVCAAYTNARQEVSILQTVEHPHIVPLLGLARRPLALLLSLAPLGSLTKILRTQLRDGLLLPVWVVRQVALQVIDALDYLHNRKIVYRDLKSDNVLVWHFPAPNNLDPTAAVLVKLADYGISKSVFPGGEAKGFAGTPPFIAPEIIVHTGRDTYTEKVDIFSFGMFLFELLTCRQPLEEIHNISMHVLSGGRPTLTTEEAIFPSHMLDLMTICWDHNPSNRPSADQVRDMAATPQFCHLADVVTMETECAVLSACSTFVDMSSSYSTEETGVESQVWVLSLLNHDPNTHRMDILSYNTNNKCIRHQEVIHDLKLVALCSVGENVWCLDFHGGLHIYSSITFQKSESEQLPISQLVYVRTMTYFHQCGDRVVILAQNNTHQMTLVLLSLEDGKLRKTESIPMVRSASCAAIVQSKNSHQIWVGVNKGRTMVLEGDNPCSAELSTYLQPTNTSCGENVHCLLIATPQHSPSLLGFAWTYNYPGNKVYMWNTDTTEKILELDCSLCIPKLESAFTHRLNVAHAQVLSLLVYQTFLYVSTTWGCILVADAATMKLLSIFRCHGNERCQNILPIGPFCNPCRMTQSADNNASDFASGVVTIGQGYFDMIKRVMQKGQKIEETDGLVENNSILPERFNTYVLSWNANHWKFY